MKNMTGLAVMAMIASTLMPGAFADPVNDRAVTVCMQEGGDLRVVPLAKMIATTMFRGIGVKIDWRAGIYACPSAALSSA
jgi:hypothetical protein